MKKIVFTGGGTGGHIYPGLAVVEELRSILNEKNEEYQIIWIGSNKGMDKTLVEKSGIVDKFIGIPCGKLRRYFSFQNFLDLFKIAAGLIKSYFVLLSIKPKVLFSKGGFVSVPPCYAAKMLKIPVYTHECDFTTGLATRLNSKVAKNLFVSYAETAEKLNSSLKEKTIVSGNPVRPSFFNADAKKGLQFIFSSTEKPKKPILLVVGGSLGAKQINETVWKNLDWLCERFEVVHQTGKQTDIKQIEHESYHQYEFIYQEMCDVMACSDVILSRAGANFLWEAMAQNKVLVLIPLGGEGSRGDQIDNAEYFENKGCALVLDCNNYTDTDFQNAMSKVLDESVRQKMSEAQKVLSNCVRASKLIGEKLASEI